MTRLFDQKKADSVLDPYKQCTYPHCKMIFKHEHIENRQSTSLDATPAVSFSLPDKVTKEYEKKADKIRPSLLPYEAVLEGIKAMEFGAKKYGVDQWRTVDMNPVDFLNALERHLLAYKQGELLAEDSGVSHLGHIIANCAILLVKFDLKGKK